MSDQCHVGAGNKVFAFSSAQVETMMSEMEDEADRVSAQIEAALLDTTFSPSSTWGGVHLPRDNSILDLYNAGQPTHALSNAPPLAPPLGGIAPCSKFFS